MPDDAPPGSPGWTLLVVALSGFEVATVVGSPARSLQRWRASARFDGEQRICLGAGVVVAQQARASSFQSAGPNVRQPTAIFSSRSLSTWS